MHISLEAFSVSKNGNTEQECEDAFTPKLNVDREENDVFRCAVADGATQSIFSGVWANILTDYYCTGNLDLTSPDSLPELRRSWLDKVGAQVLPWYAERKVQLGAYAAFVGLTVFNRTHEKNGIWESLAVGDSCLFQIRKGELVFKFPITESSAFATNPYLISTNASNNSSILDEVKCAKGTWEIDDRFLLMTDKVSEWFLQSVENGKKPWDVISDFNLNSDSFLEWVAQLRNSGEMKNDDVTIVSLSID